MFSLGLRSRCAGLVLGAALLASQDAMAQWQVMTRGDQRESRPPVQVTDTKPIQPGDPWPTDNRFRWLIGDLRIPELIGGKPSAGQVVGLQLNCGDGGEAWVNGSLQARFDNDHPALVVLSTQAVAGASVRLDAQIYGKVQGGDRFDQANWVIIEPHRALQPLEISVDPRRKLGRVPDGVVGLSQGGGVSDYEDATAAKLKAGGFRWFRMDNIFTGVLKTNREAGGYRYDWADLDRRVDFIRKIGADPILCVSYMPEVLDAVKNDERQSAPRDYGVWEELCFQAAKHNLDRGTRVPFWEVWNEVNTGWLKPGPDDRGSEPFRSIYEHAIAKRETNEIVVRRFEAYCKLYRATARGIRRADPLARIGGPALASGPMENSKDCGHCARGQGFARGLMIWCVQEKLPLDFVSWHEYFQPPQTIRREADIFREYLREFPSLERSVGSFMITEWNEAWWPDRPQDHEVGAAWCANTITRAFLPGRIDRPCFFYVKQGDMNFRGDYSLLMQDNRPKPSYHVARLFNGLRGDWIPIGTSGSATNGLGASFDEDVSGVAALDDGAKRLAIVLVNFRDRYSLARPVSVRVPALPASLHRGVWVQRTLDATHANVWNNRDAAELDVSGVGPLRDGTFQWSGILAPNSVTLLELRGR